MLDAGVKCFSLADLAATNSSGIVAKLPCSQGS